MQHSDFRNSDFRKKLTMLTGTWSQNTRPNLQPKESDTDNIKVRNI